MRTTIGFGLLITMTSVCARAEVGTSIPMIEDCASPAEVVAVVQATDHVRVRYGMGGSTQICYAVTATVNGKDIGGYLLGSAHPDVAAFEREARSHIPPIPPPAPLASDSKDKEIQSLKIMDLPKSFAGLSGTSPAGGRVSLDTFNQPTVVLYFWSANDKKSVRDAGAMEGIYNLYRGKGVGLVGVVSGTSAQVRSVMNDEEVVWPQILNNGTIAERYPQTKDLKYFILDRSRNVVAALKSSEDVQRVLTDLRKQKGGF
jgi:peroxiredoxin